MPGIGKKESTSTSQNFLETNNACSNILQFCLLFAFYTDVETLRREKRGRMIEERKRGIFYSFGFCKLHQSANFFATHIIVDRIVVTSFSKYTQIYSIHINKVVVHS